MRWQFAIAAITFSVLWSPARPAAQSARILIAEGGRHRVVLVDRATHGVIAENSSFGRVDCLVAVSPYEFLVCDGAAFVRLGPDLKERSRMVTRFARIHRVTLTRAGTFLVSNPVLKTFDEIDGNGNLVWSASVHFPSEAIRLVNGNTLVADGTPELKELDASGAAIFSAPLRKWSASVALIDRLAVGTDILVGESGGYERLGPHGDSMWFRPVPSRISCIQPLIANEIMLCEPDQDRIAIVDADGDEVWQFGRLAYGWWAIYLP